jgi:F420-non-reducing hydrogenase iron-sulfur subunit
VGDCHYVSGNHRTAKRLPLYKKLLEFAGIEPERLYLKWVSASEGAIFAEMVKQFTETLRALPPIKERRGRTRV